MSILQNRASGVLMHISSLPGAGGIGNLGRAAFSFVNSPREARARGCTEISLDATEQGRFLYEQLGFTASESAMVLELRSTEC